MTPQQLTPRLDRRMLLMAAALGGIVVGLLVMKLFSSDGDDLAVGIAPQAASVPAQTTTTLPAPMLSPDAAAVLATPRDPFGQIVSVPGTPQAGQGAPAASALAAQGAPAPQATQRASATTKPTTTSTMSTPAPTPAKAAQAVQSPPATPPPAMPQQPIAPHLVWGNVGPVAIPGVPVNVCVVQGTPSCTSTGPATSVTLTAAATIDPVATTTATILPAVCSNGGGAALLVNTGSAGTVIYVSVTVMVSGGPTLISFSLPAPTPNQSVTLGACAAPGVGVPSAGAPATPPPPTTGLGGGLLSPLLGLSGGAPVPATSGAAPTLLGLPLS